MANSSIGERISFFRKRKGLTSKEVGIKLGFRESTADVRMSQYENGARTPKSDMIDEIAKILGVSSDAISVPNLEVSVGVIQTLFRIEDIYGLTPDKINGTGSSLEGFISIWNSMYIKMKLDEITKDEYDEWRYNYCPSEKDYLAIERRRIH